MKKLFLFTFLVTCTNLIAQQTVESSLENARKYLTEDPCNSNGIGWAKSVLKLDSENEEAKTLIKNCDDIQMAEAKKILKVEPDNYKATQTLERLLKKSPDDEEMNYLVANSYLQNRPSHLVEKYISKAIKANPTNIEYRWMRLRCSLMSNASLDDYELAESDLKTMIENGAKSAKIYAYLSEAERQIGKEWKYKNVSSNNSWSDDNTKQTKEKADYNKKALEHFNKAKKAADTAIELEPKYKTHLHISSIDDSIKELNQ